MGAAKPRIIVLDPEPPDGAEVWYCDLHGRACKPSDAYMWTFTGAPQWFKIKKPDQPEEKR